MRIQFLLPMAGLTGGVKVVYEYANYLKNQGHQVQIFYPGVLFPNPQNPRWKIEARMRKIKYASEAARGKNEATQWFPLQVPIHHIPSLEARYIPDADCTIATSNETAEWVARLPKRCGSLFYFIQGHEVWSRSESEVRATYRLPLKKIVIAQFLKDIVEKEGETVCAIAPNGFNQNDFFPAETKERKTPPTILMLSHPSPEKGTQDGIDAVAIVRKNFPTTHLRMFGTQTTPTHLPPDTEYFQMPSPTQLRQLYQTADIFISPSWQEAWGLPVMESMACGTAVVATDSGGIRDFTIPDKTVILCQPHSPAELARAVCHLLEDPDLRKNIAEAGFKHIQKFKFETAAAHFMHVLEKNT